MSTISRTELARMPILGTLEPGTVQRLEVNLPGPLLADTRWPVVAIAGSKPGPLLVVTGGVHGAEYPAIETAIRLGAALDPALLSGVVVVLPVVNLPAFWKRSMFVNPIDELNPNRMFPGDPEGTYTEQLVHAVTHQFIAHADAYIDLHGGDMVEDLVPFSICRSGDHPVDANARELATVFGLPYLLTVDRPVQAAKGSMSFVAAAELGVPGFIAEAGGVGRLQPEAVELLTSGIQRVMAHLRMIEAPIPTLPPPTILGSFEWLYTTHAGMFYSTVIVDEVVEKGQIVGRVGSLFGETLEELISPVTGRVLFLTTSPAVLAKGLLMGIGVQG